MMHPWGLFMAWPQFILQSCVTQERQEGRKWSRITIMVGAPNPTQTHEIRVWCTHARWRNERSSRWCIGFLSLSFSFSLSLSILSREVTNESSISNARCNTFFINFWCSRYYLALSFFCLASKLFPRRFPLFWLTWANILSQLRLGLWRREGSCDTCSYATWIRKEKPPWKA